MERIASLLRPTRYKDLKPSEYHIKTEPVEEKKKPRKRRAAADAAEAEEESDCAIVSGATPVGPLQMHDDVVLDVGGTLFRTKLETIRKHEHCLLARMLAPENAAMCKRDAAGRLSFDRDPVRFRIVLNFMRSGALHVPTTMTLEEIDEEMAFWGFVGQSAEVDANKALHVDTLAKRLDRTARETRQRVLDDFCRFVATTCEEEARRGLTYAFFTMMSGTTPPNLADFERIDAWHEPHIIESLQFTRMREKEMRMSAPFGPLPSALHHFAARCGPEPARLLHDFHFMHECQEATREKTGADAVLVMGHVRRDPRPVPLLVVEWMHAVSRPSEPEFLYGESDIGRTGPPSNATRLQEVLRNCDEIERLQTLPAGP